MMIGRISQHKLEYKINIYSRMVVYAIENSTLTDIYEYIYILINIIINHHYCLYSIFILNELLYIIIFLLMYSYHYIAKQFYSYHKLLITWAIYTHILLIDIVYILSYTCSLILSTAKYRRNSVSSISLAIIYYSIWYCYIYSIYSAVLLLVIIIIIVLHFLNIIININIMLIEYDKW